MLVIRKEAADDIRQSYVRYESKRPSLGEDFLQQMDAVFERIDSTPLAYQIVYRRVRRALVRRFPYVDALAGAVIVRRPAKIRGVDIRGQALLKAMQLIRPDKTHFAAQRRPVTGAPQQVSPRWQARDKHGPIVSTLTAGLRS